MDMPKFSLLLLMLLPLVAISNSQISSRFAEARPLPFLPHQEKEYPKILATLGVVCKCCDGVEEGSECKSTWTGSCHSLECLPWKMI